MAGDVVAAGVHRLHPLSYCGNPAAGRAALHEFSRRVPAIDPGFAPTTLDERRIDAGRLHRRLQLGVAVHDGAACGALPRRLAGLGAVVGGKAGSEMGECAALRRSLADAGRRGGPAMAGLDGGEVEPDRRGARARRERFVGGVRTAGARIERASGGNGSGRAHDVDGRRLAAAGGIDWCQCPWSNWRCMGLR